MEILRPARTALALIGLSTAALAGCSVESYHNDASNVRCDDGGTIVDFEGEGMATFIVHGEEDGAVAAVQVRRNEDLVSVAVKNPDSGSRPQTEIDDAGFSAPVPVVEGPELSAFAAGGAWIIDVRESSAVIQGSCDG